MKCVLFIMFGITILMSASAHAEEASAKHIVGMSTGLVLGLHEHSMWLGNPMDRMMTREKDAVIGAFYQYKLTPHLRAGACLEMEFIRLHYDGIRDQARRYGVGLQFLGRYPDKLVSIHAGGHVGVGIVEGPNWDVAAGVDFSLLLGPAVEIGNMGLAIYFEPFVGWYRGDLPEDIVELDPRIKFHLYYSF